MPCAHRTNVDRNEAGAMLLWHARHGACRTDKQVGKQSATHMCRACCVATSCTRCSALVLQSSCVRTGSLRVQGLKAEQEAYRRSFLQRNERAVGHGRRPVLIFAVWWPLLVHLLHQLAHGACLQRLRGKRFALEQVAGTLRCVCLQLRFEAQPRDVWRGGRHKRGSEGVGVAACSTKATSVWQTHSQRLAGRDKED